MPDFWSSCGYRLLTTGADGRLVVTDDFLRASLLRPELAPIPESCAAELALHEKLIAAPRATVAAAEIADIIDEDARTNYGDGCGSGGGCWRFRRSGRRTSLFRGVST